MEQNRRILVVDDDSGIRGIFENIFPERSDKALMDEGSMLFDAPPPRGSSYAPDFWEIATAENGEAGERLVRESVAGEKPFAMVFLDMKMPGIDGAETARRIWKIDPRVKIVIMTAYSEFKPEEISSIAGREELFYLRKPFSRDEIRQFARSLVHQWNLERMRDRLQEELREANLHLEEKVAKRTLALQRAHERLEVLDQDKMNFLRYLSHEMNTPLNWISGATIIEREALSPEDHEMLKFMEQGLERITTLVREVVAYFEMAGGELVLNRKTLLLPALFSEILEENAREIQDTGIKIDIRIDPEQTVEADPEYFRKLMQILLQNALVYSDAGGTVTISGKREGGTFRLAIEDQGKGIQEKHLERIFQAFATEAHDRRKAGFGLNLPQARLIARAHGWRLRAESDGPDKGARMVIEMDDDERGGVR